MNPRKISALRGNENRLHESLHLSEVVPLGRELVERRRFRRRRQRLAREKGCELFILANGGKVLAARFEALLQINEVAPILLAPKPFINVADVEVLEVDA